MITSNENKKDNQSILKLAVKCMFINAKEEEKISAKLKERTEQDPAYSVIELFKEENTFSQQKLDFLLTFKKYLDTQIRDNEFGKLAIANNFTTREAINDALDFQKDCYSKTEQTLEIGEILLKTEQITLKNRTSILLVQDRIEDDLLARALDDLGSSQVEKKAINKRFGVIALKRELITLDQLNEALTEQQQDLLPGQKARYLSEILEESAGLSSDDTISILREQKQFEKRRLDLEKALTTYNSEIRSGNKLSELFKYRVPKTGLEASVSKIKDLSGEIKPYDFFSWLKQIGLKFGIVDDKIIEDFLLNTEVEEEIVIAKGYPPAEGEDESIEFLFDTDFVLPDKQKKEKIPLVKKDDVLARIIPGKKGKPGKDVWGHLIYPSDLKKCFLDCGEGAVREDLVFFADIDGIPSLCSGRIISVSPYSEEPEIHIISENIESDTKETYKSFDLEINGMIGQDAAIMCHHLMLKGDVLGNITATGDVEIKGVIGKIKKTEDETIQLSNQKANIFADGDIIARKNISNARLDTTKGLIAPNAEIISSEIVAANGIIVKSVVFNEINPSVLQIGTKSNPKIFKIDTMIKEKKTKLKELKHIEEIEEMENKYQKQLETEKECLEKNDVLKDLLKKLEESDSEGVQGLKQNQYPDTPENLKKNKYMLELVAEANKIDVKEQKPHIEKTVNTEAGMYKAAIEVTKKMCNEHKVRYEQIDQEIKENRLEIDKQELEIETLSVGRESVLLKQKKAFLPVNSVIKIKDQIAKGTVIKGQTAEMVIEETMYGVKLMEVKDHLTGETKILVEGYFS